MLGTEVDLGPGHVVLDGVPAPAKGAQQPPIFGPCLLWPRSPISATAELLFAQMTAPSSVKVAPSHGGSGPHLMHGSLGLPESTTQTASRSVQPFVQGSLV